MKRRQIEKDSVTSYGIWCVLTTHQLFVRCMIAIWIYIYIYTEHTVQHSIVQFGAVKENNKEKKNQRKPQI